MIRDRDTQYKHDLKKKERESNKLKERIHQLLADKTPNRRVGKINIVMGEWERYLYYYKSIGKTNSYCSTCKEWVRRILLEGINGFH